jgi:thiol-disulfide isomerase/thioredoxin
VRTDEKLAENSLRSSAEWKKNEIAGVDDDRIDTRLEDGDEMIDGELKVHSLSGHERNHFFLNHRAGEYFSDLSALSGLDSESDSRGFVMIDYDRDGMQDLALVNANQPLMQLFHNEIGEVSPWGRGVIALRFQGGNMTAKASGLSNRDGYGAMVEVLLKDGTVLKREHRCGDGYAAQGSRTMLIGIGEAEGAEKISVRWPSGKVTVLSEVKEGELVTVSEVETGEGRVSEVYRKGLNSTEGKIRPVVPFSLGRATPGKIQVYTTMATWCPSCLKHLPQLAILQGESVALFGVPIDPEDDDQKLDDYVSKNSPPYEMLRGISMTKRDEVSDFLASSLQIASAGLPSSVIADSEGNVLHVMQGVPTLSQLRKLMK